MAHPRRTNLRGVADKLMTWANLVFGGLVIAQAFSDSFDIQVASVGVGVFVSAYVIAIVLYMMEGGERR